MRSFFLVLGLSASCLTQAQQPETQSRTNVRSHSGNPVTLEDLLSIKSASDLALSPRGDFICYAEDGKVYVRSTGLNGRLIQVVSGRSPQWSPDGDALAFFQDSAERSNIMIRNQRTGALKLVGSLALSARALSPLRWHAENQSIELIYSKPEMASKGNPASAEQNPIRFPNKTDTPVLWGLVPGISKTSANAIQSDLYLFTSISGQSTLLKRAAPDFESLNWSPDGRKLIGAVQIARHPGRYVLPSSTLFVVDLDQTELHPIRTVLTSPGTSVDPKWSPDGKLIAYVASAKPFGEDALFVQSASGTPQNVSAKLGLSVLSFNWQSDSKSLIMQVADGVTRPIVSVALPSEQTKRLNDTEALAYSMSNNGDMAWIESTGSTFEVIRFRSASEAASVALENLNPQISDWHLGQQQVVRWKNRHGDELEGILIKPVDYQAGRQYPLIVDPYGNRVNAFMGVPILANQMLAGKGYALFFPNHRGPQTFAAQILRNATYARPRWTSDPGALEVEDIVSGVDALIRQGVADPNRIGLYGVSNGASAINFLITASDRFKAAVSFGGVTDWFNYYMFRPADDWTIPDFLNGKTPQTDLKLYLSISPLYHLANVTTPLLLVTGDQDTRALQAVLLYDGLRRLGKPVQLLRYPTEGHGLSAENLNDYWARVEKFFDDTLQHPSPGKTAAQSTP